MMLDDLLVALRTARQAAQGGITCSIDPTRGRPAAAADLRRATSAPSAIRPPPRPTSNRPWAGRRSASPACPPTTHFAQVLIASDYRMKRLAMNFEPSPVRELPSFLSMISAGPAGMNNMLPRWWLEPKYEGLFRDSDGLAWEFRGGSVKALTEEDFLNAAGAREHTGKANGAAQRWADKMTARYDELAVAEPIFGQLRNCMELAIVGRLLVKEDLPAKAGLDMSLLLDTQGLKTPEFPAPRQVDSKVSLLREGSQLADQRFGRGGHQFLGSIQHIEQSEAPAAVRASSRAAGRRRLVLELSFSTPQVPAEHYHLTGIRVSSPPQDPLQPCFFRLFACR